MIQHPRPLSFGPLIGNIHIIKLSCLLKKCLQFWPIPKILIVTIHMNFFQILIGYTCNFDPNTELSGPSLKTHELCVEK